MSLPPVLLIDASPSKTHLSPGFSGLLSESVGFVFSTRDSGARKE